MTSQDFDRSDDDALSAAARTLHEEWDTPHLWPSIAARLREEARSSAAPQRWWQMPLGPAWRLAAAAMIVVVLSSASWVIWRRVQPGVQPREVSAIGQRLLTDDAVAEIERSEAQYIHAIDELTRLAKPKLDMPDSPLIVSLRERLKTIDAAIDEYRMEIDKNRFNAHLREQLLWIYQEKRRTLQQVQESSGHAL
jgi:hypothetical protein